MKTKGPMGDILRHAKEIQTNVEEVRQRVRDQEVKASGADGHVLVTATGAGTISRIEVAPDFLRDEGLDMTLDVIAATVNRALEMADDLVDRELEGATGGLKLPGVL